MRSRVFNIADVVLADGARRTTCVTLHIGRFGIARLATKNGYLSLCSNLYGAGSPMAYAKRGCRCLLLLDSYCKEHGALNVTHIKNAHRSDEKINLTHRVKHFLNSLDLSHVSIS